MIEIKFPSDNKALAAAIGSALMQYGGQIVSFTKVGEVVSFGRVAGEAKRGLTDEERDALPCDDVDGCLVSGVEKVHDILDLSGDAPVAGNPDAPKDEKGVGFNAEYCGKAAVPYYASGKTKGQWKKRQGVEQDAYDAWYAAELAKLPAEEVVEPPPVETKAAFSKVDPPPAETGPRTFTEAGEFMQWMSEKQAAELISQADVDAAYAETEVAIQDLFNPASAPAAIAKVYGAIIRSVPGAA